MLHAQVVQGQVIIVGGQQQAPSSESQAKPVPLVQVDSLSSDALQKAARFIEQKNHVEAIRCLQGLSERANPAAVVESEAGRTYISLRRRAQEMLASMGEEGLGVYRRMYDPQAQALYEAGVAEGNPEPLRRVADFLGNTTYGPKALDALGALAFDRGEFTPAARYWAQALRAGAPPDREPLLLAKLAAAYHLSARSAEYDKVLADLKKRYPEATEVFGGEERKVVEFAGALRELPVASAVGLLRSRAGWPGLGGVPNGLAVMPDADVVLAPLWRHPVPEGRSDVLSDLVVSVQNLGSTRNPHTNQPMPLTAAVEDGHVMLRPQAQMGQGTGPLTLPPFVQPVVVDEVVYYRSETAVVACDLVTGKVLWKSHALPVTRQEKVATNHGWWGGHLPFLLQDVGRYTLTVGGTNLYCVANFQSPMARMNRMNRAMMRPGQGGGDKDPGDTSELVALSIDGQLKRAWYVGNGTGTSEIARSAKYLCAPTYHDGRLYVPVVYVHNFYLLCFDAATGSLLWESYLAEAPLAPQQYRYGMGLMQEPGSPPAVSGGRVFATSNAGVVSCFDAFTGQIIWAHQYHAQTANANQMRAMARGGLPQGQDPPNPIILTGGRVIVLPADSQNLLILSAEDGRVLHEIDRRSQHNLTALDADRLLLSGPSLRVVSAMSGRELWATPEILRIQGRPAVTPTSVLASGTGELIRLEHSEGKYELTRAPMSSGAEMEGLLGNLVSVKDEIIAANATGLCAYMSYEQNRAKLTERLDAETVPVKRAEWLLQRGQFAFNARRYETALEDLQAADALAKDVYHGKQMQTTLRTWTYFTYVALGNQAKDPRRMREHFETARDHAQTDHDRAHMLLRLARCHRAAAVQLLAETPVTMTQPAGPVTLGEGPLVELRTAVQYAQELLETYGEEKLVDLAIGPAARAGRFRADTPRQFGRTLARTFIEDIIAEFGRSPYAPYDAMARVAYEQAKSAEDPDALAAVADRWCNSEWRDDARYAAAERLFLAARDLDTSDADAAIARYQRQLDLVTSDSPDARLKAAAHAALALSFAKRLPNVALQHCMDAESAARQAGLDDPMTLSVTFADRTATLKEIAAEANYTGGASPVQEQFSMVRPPLREVFRLQGDNVTLLRDQELRPIRLGQRLLAMRGDRIVFVNTSAPDANSAITWAGLADGQSGAAQGRMPWYGGGGAIAGLSADGNIVALCDQSMLRGYDARTAKATWALRLTELGLTPPVWMGLADGRAVLADSTGRVVCVDLAQGEKKWESSLVSGPNNPRAGQVHQPFGPPQIESGLVLFTSNHGRQGACFHLGNGKLLKQWTAQQGVQFLFAPNGLLLVMTDDKLEAYDPAVLKAPIWTRPYKANNRGTLAAVLAAGRDVVIVSDSHVSTKLEVIGLLDGQKRMEDLDMARGAAMLPVDATIRGNELYVTCSQQAVGRRKYIQGRFSQVQGAMAIQKFTLGPREAKREWTAQVGTGPVVQVYTLPLVFGQQHLAVTIRPLHMASTVAQAVLLDAGTGEAVGEFPIAGAGPGANVNANEFMQKMFSVGPPTMTNGQLCVETTEGLVIYGE